jgi:hypothetical protein
MPINITLSDSYNSQVNINYTVEYPDSTASDYIQDRFKITYTYFCPIRKENVENVICPVVSVAPDLTRIELLLAEQVMYEIRTGGSHTVWTD